MGCSGTRFAGPQKTFSSEGILKKLAAANPLASDQYARPSELLSLTIGGILDPPQAGARQCGFDFNPSESSIATKVDKLDIIILFDKNCHSGSKR